MVEVVVAQQPEVVLGMRVDMLVEILQRKIKIIDITHQVNKLLNVCSIQTQTTVRQVIYIICQGTISNSSKYFFINIIYM